MKHITVLSLFLSFFFVIISPSYAVNSRKPVRLKPTKIVENQSIPFHFGNCPNPGGNVIASYDQGWHWIVGNSVLQWGSDKVYSLSNDNYVQCFCPQEYPNFKSHYSDGVQTNWLKASDVSESLKTQLISQGWIWVENGADFGLANAPYLAQNLSFSCHGIVCNTTIIQQNELIVKGTIIVQSNTGNNHLRENTGGTQTFRTGNVTNIISQITVGGSNLILSP